MTLLSAAERAAIRQRCEQASKGPWEPYDNHVIIPNIGAVGFVTDNPMYGDSSHDTHFIAHARSDTPRLLDALEQAEAESAALIAQVRALRDKWVNEAAIKDTYHATMGIGWKSCAEELDALLPRTPERTTDE